jgi:hypothetical protein
MPGIGQTKCQSDQNERDCMFAVLAEAGVGPKARRTQCRERHGGGQ